MGIQVCSNEGPHPILRGDDSNIGNYIDDLKFSSTEQLAQFLPNLVKSSLGRWWYKFVQMKDPVLRGDNSKKIEYKHLKIFFPRTSEPISNKLGTKHSWVIGIQTEPHLYSKGR